MKLGLLAALTGIAVAVGLSRKKRAEAVPAPAGKRRKLPATPPKGGPVTSTAPHEGVNMKAAAPSPARNDGGARVTAP